MSGGWSWYVIALVALNIVGCAWLLWWTAQAPPGRSQARGHQPRLGRRHHRVQQAAAAVVDQPVLPDHRRSRSATCSGIPGWAASPATASGRRQANTPQDKAADDAKLARDLRAATTASRSTCSPRDPQARRARPLDLQQHLRDLPRLVRAGRDRLSQPHRRHLALGRLAGTRAGDGARRPRRRDARMGQGADRHGRRERGRLRGRLRACAVAAGAVAAERLHGRAGQAAVRRRVRGLPRRRRQGQSGAGRARPDRRLLAVRRQHRRRCARRSPRAATA